MRWWIGDLYQAGETVVLVSRIFWVIFSICLHELAHGWAAIWQGDDTPRRLGHMTMNPLVHMGPWSLAIFALTGWAWGLMPTDPSKYRWRRRGHIVVAGAGPAMNLLIAFVSLTALVLWWRFADPTNQPRFDNVGKFLWYGGAVNVMLAFLNMLPIPPLDGASVLSGLSFSFYRLIRLPNAMTVGFVLLILILNTPIARELFGAAEAVAIAFVRFMQSLLSMI
jgi:Zn-dependent protease